MDRNTTYFLTVVAGFLVVGVLVGVGRMWKDARRWREELGREKATWERARDERT